MRDPNTKLRHIIIGILLAALVPAAPAADAQTTAAEVARLVETHGPRLLRSRYMEKNCEPATYPGWEGYPLQKCRYTVTDRDGTTKTAEAIMLNASPEQVARWVVNAVGETTASNLSAACDRLFTHIIGQSGGQYPVAGIVYEDILPADGVYEIFCFRNGVTVEIEGVAHRGTEQLTPDQIALSLHGRVVRVYRYARIQSTNPADYIANGGSRAVGTNDARTPEWLEASRECYQAAWSRDSNEMLIAWARARLAE